MASTWPAGARRSVGAAVGAGAGAAGLEDGGAAVGGVVDGASPLTTGRTTGSIPVATASPVAWSVDGVVINADTDCGAPTRSAGGAGAGAAINTAATTTVAV